MKNGFKFAARIALLTLLLQAMLACGGADERKQRHLQKAKALYDNGHHALALEEYKNASYIKPSDVTVRYQLAKTYEKLNDSNAAITSYRHILALQPEDQQPRIRLGQLYLNIGDLIRALEQAEALLGKDASSAEGLLIRSQVRSRQGQFLAALRDAQDALKSSPKKIDSRIQLASLYLHQQHNELAVQLIRKGLEQSPGNARLLVQLAKVYSLRGARAHAEEFLQSALKSDVDNSDYYSLLSRLSVESTPEKPVDLPPWLTLHDEFFPDQNRLENILKNTPSALNPLSLLTRMLISKGEYTQADFYIQKALVVEPDNTIARNFLAEILIKQKQYSKAVVHLDQVIRTQPDWWLAYRNKSLALVEEGNTTRAIQTYKNGIKFSRETEILRLDLALLYEKNEQAVQAVTVYERMLRENQQASEASNNLAMLLSDKETFPDGLSRAQQLIKTLEWEGNPAFLDTIGWVQLKSGNTDTAVLALTRAAKDAPDTAMIQYHLGKAYLQAGDKVNAQRQLKKAIRLNNSFGQQEDAMALLQVMNSPASKTSASVNKD